MTAREHYPLHDLVRIFPAQTPEEYEEIKASIATVGQMQRLPFGRAKSSMGHTAISLPRAGQDTCISVLG